MKITRKQALESAMGNSYATLIDRLVLSSQEGISISDLAAVIHGHAAVNKGIKTSQFFNANGDVKQSAIKAHLRFRAKQARPVKYTFSKQALALGQYKVISCENNK